MVRVSGELSSLALVSSAWSLDEVDVSWDCSLENEFNCSFDCYIRFANLQVSAPELRWCPVRAALSVDEELVSMAFAEVR